MTPAARHQAAIEILDRILAGASAEQALTNWARKARFAGSSDRVAIRDLVFDILRRKRSCAHLGGAQTGRGLILGLIRAEERDPAEVFTGEAYAPARLNSTEAAPITDPMPEAVALDCPDWLLPAFKDSFGTSWQPVLEALRHRAPVFLRVNLARSDLDRIIAQLATEGIRARPHPLAPSALEITGKIRAITRTQVYLEGLVELQDAASQSVLFDLPAVQGKTVLDYCAGGGGKALALAALGAQVTAHDANPVRMRDLPVRAKRAKAEITLARTPTGLFDLVLTDVPCSGSGSWRRTPAGKWALRPETLATLTQVQSVILHEASGHVRPGGTLAYVTCSLLACENHTQIEAFLSDHQTFTERFRRQLTPLDGGDGFFISVLERCA